MAKQIRKKWTKSNKKLCQIIFNTNTKNLIDLGVKKGLLEETLSILNFRCNFNKCVRVQKKSKKDNLLYLPNAYHVFMRKRFFLFVCEELNLATEIKSHISTRGPVEKHISRFKMLLLLYLNLFTNLFWPGYSEGTFR